MASLRDRIALRPGARDDAALWPAAGAVVGAGLVAAAIAATYAVLVASSVESTPSDSAVARWNAFGDALVGLAGVVVLGLLAGWLLLAAVVLAATSLDRAVDAPVERTLDGVQTVLGDLQSALGDGLVFGGRVPAVEYVDALGSAWLAAAAGAVVGFASVVVAWVVIAALLDVLADVAVLGYERSFGRALVVAAWGFVPVAVGVLVQLLFVAAGYVGAILAPGAVSWYTFRVQYDTLLPLRVLVGLGVVGWQTLVWGAGLDAARDPDLTENPRAVYVVAGVVAAGAWLLQWVA